MSTRTFTVEDSTDTPHKTRLSIWFGKDQGLHIVKTYMTSKNKEYLSLSAEETGMLREELNVKRTG